MTFDLVQAINQSTGYNLKNMESLRTRKGHAYKVEENGNEMLLKIIELKKDEETTTRRSLQKEAQILRKLNDFTGSLYVNSGEVLDHFWLLRKWINETAWEHTMYVRKDSPSFLDKQRFVYDLIQMLQRVI